MRRSILVVAGEGSGDAMAAPVIERLGASGFGIGGPRLKNAGIELLGEASELAAIGVGPTFARAPAITRALVRLLRGNPAPASPRCLARRLQRAQHLARRSSARARHTRPVVRRAAGLGVAPGPCGGSPARL